LHIIDKVDCHGISRENICFLNQQGYFYRVPFTASHTELDVSLGQLKISRPTELFKRPFIVEMTGAGFDKPPNTSYFTLRFPRIQKIHQDRTLKEIVGYDELQKLAKRAMEPFSGGKSEESCWLEKLQRADPRNSSRKRKLSLGHSPRLAPPAKQVNITHDAS
jgi:DNA ligase-4